MSTTMQASSTVIPLKYPMSVATYPTYAEAQRAVDHLADNGFPVENLCIVGTELKQVERVLGRLTWGRVLLQGIVSGFGTGIFFGLVMMLFLTQVPSSSAFMLGVVMGVGMGIITALLGHAATGGKRDFASVQAIVATRYEVLGEHTVVNQAREMLGQSPVQQPAPTVWPPVPRSDGQQR